MKTTDKVLENQLDGYVYCISNPTYVGLLKIGYTERSPELRLAEANKSNTWIPTPFKIEFAKKVKNCQQKEKNLHQILEQYSERITSKEFFRVSKEEVLSFFNLMDGEETSQVCRTFDCFSDGQRISHTIGINKIWIGTYDSINKKIMVKLHGETKNFKTLSALAMAHNLIELPHRLTNTANGWKECKCEINGEWVSTFALPALR